MWIKRIELKNFMNIWTGLHVKRLMIDFSNREHTICLIIGPNGIGKTSFLSCLTPFATLGNLDIRDGNSIIIEGENGYKKIVIMDGEVEYEIEHFYTASKNTHTVKSYFKENGIELNPNGNVTSFKERVKEFFGIDMDYLKLIRIGDNVTNLIKLKATDRKNFMSKFLDSVDIYLKYNKKITEDVKDIKLIISHNADKIGKLHIDDLDGFISSIETIKDGIHADEKEIERLRKNLAEINMELGSLFQGKREDLLLEIREKKKLIDKWEKALQSEKNQKYLNDCKNQSNIDQLREEREKKEKKFQWLTGTLEGKSQIRDSLLKRIDTLYRELTEIKKRLELEKSNSNIDSLEDYIKTLHNKRKELEERITFSSPTELSKTEVDDFVVMLKNVQRALNTTYEFGKPPIEEALALIQKNGDVTEYVVSKLLAIEKKKKRDERTYLDTLVDKYANIKRPEGCDCVLLRLYDDLMMVRKVSPSNPNAVKNEEYYQMVKAVHDNIIYCLEELEKNKEKIQKLPGNIQKDFVLETLYQNIRDCKYIYSEKKINQLMSEVTELDYYNSVLQELQDAFEKLAKEKETSRIGFYEEEILHRKKEVEETEKELSKIETEIDEVHLTLTDISVEKEEMDTLIDALEKYTDIVSEYQHLVEVNDKIEKLVLVFKDCKMREMQLVKEREFLTKQLREKEFILNEYKKLNKELQKAQEIYDDLVAIKTSTSNKEGIPLLYIKLYLKDIKEFANELLDIVYHGELYLDDFDIASDAFRIPFIKNGIKIPDISFASQGEQSFLSMAISFALTAKNLDKYNIPLLDEVDATFDRNNRERCLDIIEHQNETIQCEQEFIISHNNMYSQYGVDVLDFNDLKHSKFDIEVS